MAKTKPNTQDQLTVQETISCTYVAHTPCYFSYKGNEFALINNQTYNLPDIDFVQSLIGQGRLVKK